MKKLLIVLGVVVMGAAMGLAQTQNYHEITGRHIISATVVAAGDDSTNIAGTAGLGKVYGYKDMIMAEIRIRDAYPVDTNGTVGIVDSGYLYLLAEFAGNIDTLAQDSCAALPCSLKFASVAATLDSLLKGQLLLGYKISDSVDDTVNDGSTFYWNIDYNILLK